MKDFRGIELEVGDRVIYASSNHLHKGLNEGTVLDINLGIGKNTALIKGYHGFEIKVMSKNIVKDILK